MKKPCFEAPMRLAVLTSSTTGVYADDVGLFAALERLGVEPVPVVWRETSVAALSTFEAVLMRTPWDWYRHRAEFRALLKALTTLTCPVINDAALMERFADKTYFKHLSALGVPTVPTEFFAPGSGLERLPAVVTERGWRHLVLKPSFTANAYGALRFEAADAAKAVAHAHATPIDSEWMLQPFVEGVTAEGEWSLLFFGGVFSHAVCKRPKPGDFRVQHEHGGVAEAATPPAAMLSAATHIAQRAVPEAVLARVDGVWFEGAFVVMEIEVVEPELFLRTHSPAASMLAEAIVRSLARPS